MVGAGGQHVARLQLWMEVTHSTQRGILLRQSLVLKFCFTVRSREPDLPLMRVGDLVGGHEPGPSGAKVSRDFIW